MLVKLLNDLMISRRCRNYMAIEFFDGDKKAARKWINSNPIKNEKDVMDAIVILKQTKYINFHTVIRAILMLKQHENITIEEYTMEEYSVINTVKPLKDIDFEKVIKAIVNFDNSHDYHQVDIVKRHAVRLGFSGIIQSIVFVYLGYDIDKEAVDIVLSLEDIDLIKACKSLRDKLGFINEC